MSGCGFDIGDSVLVQGICGRVMTKEPLGDGWVLGVLLPGGGVVSVSCSDAAECGERASAPCGSETVSGRPCMRLVGGRKRCSSHAGPDGRS